MRVFHWFNLLAFCVLALLVSLILGKKEKNRSDWFLIIYLSLTSLSSLGVFIFFEYSIIWLLHVIMLYGSQLVTPFKFFYILSLLKPGRKMKKRYFLVFLPLVNSLLQLVVSLILNPQEVVTRFTAVDLSSMMIMDTAPLYYQVTLFIEVLYDPVLVVFLLYALWKYRLHLKQSYSNLQKIEYPWIRLLLWMNLAGSVLIVFPGMLMGALAPEDFELIFTIGIGIGAFSSVYIGYFGLKNTRIFVSLPVIEPEEDSSREKYIKTPVTRKMAEEIQVALENTIREDKLYLNPKLNLSDLAQAVGVRNHVISEIFNVYMNTNFYEYINDQRVEEAKQKLTDGSLETETILGIALDSGFNSKSSFNRIFKLKTGFTPSQFAKQKSLSEK